MENFTQVIGQLSQTIHESKRPQFFECLMNLIGAFKSHLTEQHLVTLLQALVTQIVQDTNDNKPSKKTLDLRQGKSSNKDAKNKKLLKLRIARCWSIIRFLAEDPAIVYSD